MVIFQGISGPDSSTPIQTAVGRSLSLFFRCLSQGSTPENAVEHGGFPSPRFLRDRTRTGRYVSRRLDGPKLPI